MYEQNIPLKIHKTESNFTFILEQFNDALNTELWETFVPRPL